MGGLCKEVLRGEADAPEAECEQRSPVRRKRPSAAVRYSVLGLETRCSPLSGVKKIINSHATTITGAYCVPGSCEMLDAHSFSSQPQS